MKETISKAPSGRPARKPVGARNKLEILNKDPHKAYRLIDSDPARIHQFLSAGYEIEDLKAHLPGSQLRVDSPGVVDNALAVGGGARHVLVSIDRELYDADQRAKQVYLDETEEAISKPKTSDGQYGTVKIGDKA